MKQAQWGIICERRWHAFVKSTYVGLLVTRCGRTFPLDVVIGTYDAPFGEHPVCAVCQANVLTDLLRS